MRCAIAVRQAEWLATRRAHERALATLHTYTHEAEAHSAVQWQILQDELETWLDDTEKAKARYVEAEAEHGQLEQDFNAEWKARRARCARELREARPRSLCCSMKSALCSNLMVLWY